MVTGVQTCALPILNTHTPEFEGGLAGIEVLVLDLAAQPFVDEAKGVASAEEALAGAMDILAERFSEDLGLLGLLLSSCSALLTAATGLLLQNLQSRRSRLKGRIRAYLYQAFYGIEAVRTAGAEDFVLHEYVKKALSRCRWRCVNRAMPS